MSKVSELDHWQQTHARLDRELMGLAERRWLTQQEVALERTLKKQKLHAKDQLQRLRASA